MPPGAVESAELTRIAELEAQLSRERTDSSRRLKEVEPRIQQFREALQSMHLKLKQAAEEQLLVDARLAGEAHETARLALRVAELEEQTLRGTTQDSSAAASIGALEGEQARRDAALAGAIAQSDGTASRVDTVERKLGAARDLVVGLREALVDAKRKGAQAGAEADHAAPLAADDGHPDVIGLRIDGAPQETALGRRYEAHDTDSRRDVEILVFSHELSKLNGSRLDALLQARHQNLASAIAFGRTRARPYVVFERASGETLEEWVRRAGPAPEQAALRVALQIARGLREAAFHGALHGDLSPHVVRVTPSGDVKVEDTGLGELHPPSTRPLTSPEFAAPERLRDGAPPDARADIFSLGAVLHFLLTGRAPFETDAPRSAGPGPDPRKRCPTTSPEVAQLVTTLTDHESSARPATWDEALLAIERLARVRACAPRDVEPRPVGRFVAAHPFLTTAIAAAPLVAAALWLRFGTGHGASARERFDVAARHADVLAARGDTVGAAFALGRYLRDTGDTDVEREALEHLDKLRKKR